MERFLAAASVHLTNEVQERLRKSDTASRCASCTLLKHSEGIFHILSDFSPHKMFLRAGGSWPGESHGETWPQSGGTDPRERDSRGMSVFDFPCQYQVFKLLYNNASGQALWKFFCLEGHTVNILIMFVSDSFAYINFAIEWLAAPTIFLMCLVAAFLMP